MAKLKLKKIIQIAFFVVVAAAVLDQLASVYSGWQSGRRIRAEIWSNAHIAVIKTDPRFPPSLLVEYVNGSRYAVEKTRFLLMFTLGGQEVATTEREFREMKPGEKEHVLLESVAAAPAAKPPGPSAKLAYHLLVFPGQKKPLPDITGEIELR